MLNGTKTARDPNQTTLLNLDFDNTIGYNVNGFVLELVQNPGWINQISGLPQTVVVPVNDYEGNTGLKIKDRIGHWSGGAFIPSSSIEPVTLSNGVVFPPGYYVLNPNVGLEQFRRSENPKESHILNATKDLIKTRTPFLLEGAILLSIAHEYQRYITPNFLTDRGDAPGMKLTMEEMAKSFHWKKLNYKLEQMVNLSDPAFLQYGRSKTKFIQGQFVHLVNRTMQRFDVPHFQVMVEDKIEYIKAFHERFEAQANSGFGSNPVVPILVNLVEQEVFEIPDGIDWNRTALYSQEPMWRVTIYWPGRTERTNSIPRLLEVILGISSEQAVALYEWHSQQLGSYLCRNIGNGDLFINGTSAMAHKQRMPGGK